MAKTTLKKDKIYPGMLLRIRTDVPLSNGLESSAALMGGKGTNDGFACAVAFVTASTRDRPGLSHFTLAPGDLCTLVHGPKMIVGANVARVKNDSGQEGYVYWCELKANCLPHDPEPVPSCKTFGP